MTGCNLPCIPSCIQPFYLCRVLKGYRVTSYSYLHKEKKKYRAKNISFYRPERLRCVVPSFVTWSQYA